MLAFDEQPLFLIGFMGTGKSTVGPLVATKLGRRFVDLDALVEAEAHATIAELWAAEGEAGFRRRERALLDRIVDAGPQVIALGGGTPCFADNMGLLLRSGKVVCLSATEEELGARLGDPASRPLLASAADPRREIARLLGERRATYARAHLMVDTTGSPPSRVAKRIVDEAGAWK